MIENKAYDCLNGRQKKLIAALLVCRTKNEAAKNAGISRDQMFFWFREDTNFVAAYKQALHNLLDEARDLIIQETSKSIVHLATVRDGKANAFTRMLAAKYLTDYGIKFYEVMKVEDRLDAIEKRLNMAAVNSNGNGFASLEDMSKHVLETIE